MSNNQLVFLKKRKREKWLVKIVQLIFILIFVIIWELSARYNLINTFIYSSPSRIINCIKELYVSNNLFNHILMTMYEIFIAFSLGGILGFISAVILYEFKILAKIIDPFLTLLNSMPKVALGPLIIIVAGANIKSVILMALLINLIVTIITIYNGFITTDENKIKLLKTFKANKLQILIKLIIPENLSTIISAMKLNISMTLIGVIMGEFLVSQKGIGYLIIYGTQIFNLNLVMSGLILLVIISFILYKLILFLENIYKKKN